MFKGHVVRLLRHPCGSRVINELYTAASTKQRRALTAEFYGREAVLFHEVSSPSCQPHMIQASLFISNACGMRSTLLEACLQAEPLMSPGFQAAMASCPSCRCCLKRALCRLFMIRALCMHIGGAGGLAGGAGKGGRHREAAHCAADVHQHHPHN